MQMWRMGLPVATPIRVADFLTASAAFVMPGNQRSEFEREAREFLDVPFARSTNSGRSALFFVLQAMKRLSTRNEVVLPAYVCPSVGRAVVKAGLKPILCDVAISGSGLNMSCLEQVAGHRTLAIIAAHLYGYPTDIAPTCEIARSVGAMVVEDAAQSFSARWQGRCVGTSADAGIFSFGMSKTLWAMGGGLIASTIPKLGRQVDDVMASSQDAGHVRQAAAIAKLAMFGVLARCHHLGPLAVIWGSLLRGRDDLDDFAASTMPSTNAAVARALLKRVAEITRLRALSASYFDIHLSDFDELTIPEIHGGSDPVFLRYSIIVKNLDIRRQLIDTLRRRGINVSNVFAPIV